MMIVIRREWVAVAAMAQHLDRYCLKSIAPLKVE